MVDIVTPIDYEEQGITLMLSQFKNSPNLQALLKSWLLPIQDLEDTLQAFARENGITTASGTTLDIIGSWLGVEREFRVDEEYRSAILAESIIEKADGTTESLMNVLRSLAQSSFVNFYELYPETVYSHLGTKWNLSTYGQIKKAVMAGTHLRLLVDHYLDSMTLSELIDESNRLGTSDGDDYVLVKDGLPYYWTVSKTLEGVTDDSGDYLAEGFDTEWAPMAELITQSFRVVEGFIVDDQGNNIVDNNGNPLIYRGFE